MARCVKLWAILTVLSAVTFTLCLWLFFFGGSLFNLGANPSPQAFDSYIHVRGILVRGAQGSGAVLAISLAGLLHTILRPAWVSRQRVRMGLCGKCSYDLTGNTSGRCPECGTAVSSPAEPAT